MCGRSVFVLLVVVGCAAHHTAPERPLEPGPESRFFLVADADGARHLVRVTAATAELEVVGGPLDPAAEGSGVLYQENAPFDRALVRSSVDGRQRWFSFRSGEWVSLCADVGGTDCDVRPTRDLAHLIISASGEDREALTFIRDYRGRRLAELGADSAPLMSILGTEEWTLWGRDGEWSITSGDETGAFELSARERPLQPFARHVLTRDEDTPNRYWFRSIPDGERSAALCPDGTAPQFIDSDITFYAKCADGLVRIGDGILNPTGVEEVGDRDEGGSLAFVLDDLFSLRTVRNMQSSVRLHGTAGELLGEYIWTPEEVVLPPGESPESSAYAYDTVGGAQGVVTAMDFERRVFGPSDFAPQRETYLLTFGRDGSVASLRLLLADDADASSIWLPRSVDRSFWITEGGRLMMRDHFSDATADVSGGWTFTP